MRTLSLADIRTLRDCCRGHAAETGSIAEGESKDSEEINRSREEARSEENIAKEISPSWPF
jgi:hypothetical protein